MKFLANAGYSRERARLFGCVSVGFVFAWFGVMNFTSVGAGLVEKWLQGHLILNFFAEGSAPVLAPILAKVIGAIQIIGAVLMVVGSPLWRSRGAALLSLLVIGALTLLLSNPVWMAEAGGFPAIGSGQGILKYIAILGLLFYLGTERQRRFMGLASANFKAAANPLMLFGLILVLAWIGAMKFTAAEAAAIAPLLEGNPLFSWLEMFLSEQGSSNLIGVAEIITALLLLAGWFNRTLFSLGALMCIATFA
ncbi:MAG: DUF417 family protein, partial [Sphingomonadales bacterium]